MPRSPVGHTEVVERMAPSAACTIDIVLQSFICGAQSRPVPAANGCQISDLVAWDRHVLRQVVAERYEVLLSEGPVLPQGFIDVPPPQHERTATVRRHGLRRDQRLRRAKAMRGRRLRRACRGDRFLDSRSRIEDERIGEGIGGTLDGVVGPARDHRAVERDRGPRRLHRVCDLVREQPPTLGLPRLVRSRAEEQLWTQGKRAGADGPGSRVGFGTDMDPDMIERGAQCGFELLSELFVERLTRAQGALDARLRHRSDVLALGAAQHHGGGLRTGRAHLRNRDPRGTAGRASDARFGRRRRGSLAIEIERDAGGLADLPVRWTVGGGVARQQLTKPTLRIRRVAVSITATRLLAGKLPERQCVLAR